MFNRADNVVFSNLISGSGSVTQLGPGLLVLTNSNTYSGQTTIGGGTLQVDNGGPTGWISNSVTNNGVLVFSRSDSPTYSGQIGGSGKVDQAGAGVLTLANPANSYTGATSVNSGTLSIGSLAVGGSPSSIGQSSNSRPTSCSTAAS